MFKQGIGLYGSFETPEQVRALWYRFTLKNLEDEVNSNRKALNEQDVSERDIEISNQRVESSLNDINEIKTFIDNFNRCMERFKHNKKLIAQVEDELTDYNLSLYSDWCNLQAFMLSLNEFGSDEHALFIEECRRQKIIREEIARRVMNLLQ